MANKKIN
ncbi:hypothetical protein YPPY60_1865, partial [Yersinia pestis PY-60]